MRQFYAGVLLVLFIFWSSTASAQSVLNPADTIVNYNPANPPTQPPYGQIGKWVRTQSIFAWNTSSFKAYIYKGCAFRLKFPKSYNPNANDGKKYPIIIMFHGLGEAGPITDNESQLYHQGQFEMNAVDSGTFDGYLLYMQSQGFWGQGQYQFLTELVDFMAQNNKVDPFHVCVHGLSAGGQGAWEMMLYHPTYVSCDLPMSNISIGYDQASVVNEVKYTPIWDFQGGLDGSPAPSTAHQVRDSMWAYGANYTYTEFPNLGHGCWDTAAAQPDFFPFMLRAYLANPWPLFGRTNFCPGDSINVTLGLVQGFDAYQWRMNGVVISGAISNTLQVVQPGTYDARVLRGANWSDWSHTPVVIQINAPTPTPVISVSGLMSDVIPATDGKNYVNLQVNNSYSTYSWELASNDSLVSMQPIFKATQPGNYIVSVKQQYGCSSVFSAPFTVYNSVGIHVPDPASNLIATTISNTQIELDWANNQSPQYNETAFEIYRGTTSGGPYTFAGQVPTDSLKFIDNGLSPKTKYYYRIRAVNNNGAAALSNEASAITTSDTVPPTIPGNLTVLYTDRNSVGLSWTASTDNVSLAAYDVFINGIKTYSTTQTNIVAGGLAPALQYAFYVKARDASGNYSSQSNQVSASTILTGLHYKYYQGTWDSLPNFNNYTPVAQGISGNTDVSVKLRLKDIGFLWQGYINIPVAGTYKFQTYSNDGSKVWLSPYNPSAPALVNNDGSHPLQYATSASINLQPGIYPISIAFFQTLGNPVMQINWSCNQLFGDTLMHQIANQYFQDTAKPAGTAPAIPTGVTAIANSPNKITVTWNDNSNNETGFEVYRSQASAGPYNILTTVSPNTLSISDSALQPSTTYYYRVQAINQFGSSGFDPLSAGGLQYSFYNGAWNLLPDFDSLTAASSGFLTNTTLAVANGATQYALQFKGVINIPTTGLYTFLMASNDGSQLFINGSDSSHLVVNNNSLNPPTGNRTGTVQLTQGAYPFYVNYFQNKGSSNLVVRYQGPKVKQQIIPDSAFVNHQSSATTTAVPPAPLAPLNFAAAVASSSSIVLSWKDTATTETGYKLFRSIGDSTKFLPLIILPPNTISYTDSALFSNQLYYYKLSALGIGGTSSNAQTTAYAKTNDNFPVITKIPLNRSVRYGIITTINFTATDADAGNLLTFSTQNLPSFASFVDNGNRTATLTLNPAKANQGTYNNVKIFVNDNSGGTDSTVFNLIVNSNYDPSIANIPNYVLTDNIDTAKVIFQVNDKNTTDSIRLNFGTLPNFITVGQGWNGRPDLIVKPNYSSIGSYNIQVNASDSNGGYAYTQFNILINDRVPQINPINNVTLKNNQQLSVNISAMDDSADHITLSATGLPAFAQLVDNGNGSGMININPTAGITGTYPVTVSAADISDSVRSTSFVISIVDKDVTSVYINFSDGSVAPAPWNNLTAWPAAGVSLNNLLDDNNNASGLAVTLTTGFQKNGEQGMQTGGDNSVYPDIVMLTSEMEGSSNTDAINVSGLNASKKYNFVFFNSNNNSYNTLTNFTINGQTVSLNGSYNTNKTAQINGISPDINGNVNISIAKAAGADYAYLSSLIIQSYDSVASPLLSPANLVVVNKTSSSVKLQWADRSSNETGFQVYRAVDSVNGYTLLASLPANTVNYTDSNLVSNKTYYYTVVSVQNGSVSTYSNTAAATTYAYSVYLNFTASNNAPAPWNNLDAGEPQNGYIWNSFLDANGLPTSLGMQLTSDWAGLYSDGMNTGNNSGLFPDDVMIDSYGLYTGQTGTIQITGMNLAMQYDFTFFASSQFFGDVTGAYTVNGKTVILNASFNTQGTVTLHGIIPDNNGNATISITTADNASQFGLIGGLIMQGYTKPANSSTPQPHLLKKPKVSSASEIAGIEKINIPKTEFSVSAYPNPFHQYINLSVGANNNDKIAVMIFDMNGKAVYQNEFGNLASGNNNLKIETAQSLTAGVYFLRVFDITSQTSKTIKIIRQ